MNDFATELAHDGAVEDSREIIRVEEARDKIVAYAEGLRVSAAWLNKFADTLAQRLGMKWTTDGNTGMLLGSADYHEQTIFFYGDEEEQRELFEWVVTEFGDGAVWKPEIDDSSVHLRLPIAGNFSIRFRFDRVVVDGAEEKE